MVGCMHLRQNVVVLTYPYFALRQSRTDALGVALSACGRYRRAQVAMVSAT